MVRIGKTFGCLFGCHACSGGDSVWTGAVVGSSGI